MSAKVKIAVVTEEKDTPCRPCINYDFDKELKRVLEPVYEMNQDIEFTVSKYTDRSQAESEKLLYGRMSRQHRVTVFGDYRKLFMQLFKVKGIEVIEEDK